MRLGACRRCVSGLLLTAVCAQPRAAQRSAAVARKGEQDYVRKVSLAGAISCSVTHTAVVPLDVIKTKLQMTPGIGGREAIAAVWASAQHPFRVRAFLQGARPTAIGYWMQGTFKFGAHAISIRTATRAPRREVRWPGSSRSSGVMPRGARPAFAGGYELGKRAGFGYLRARQAEGGPDLVEALRLPVMLASAAAAELIATFFLCPLEVVKLRMQTDAAALNAGLVGTLGHTVRMEGVGALYRGYVPIALRQVPYTACKLVTFELVACALLGAVTRLAASDEPFETRLRPLAVLAAGLVAGSAAAVVSQPADLLLTRLCGSSSASSLAECVIAEGVRDQARRPAPCVRALWP